MRSFLIAVIVGALAVGGCKPKEADNAASRPQASGNPRQTAPGGGSDTIRPLTPSGGVPNAPIAGGENLGSGSGGGVGQAAKDAARKSAQGHSNSTDGDDEGGE